jgi:putative flippase GtrA
MIAYARKRIFRILKIDFVRFCIVGGTGFVINFVLLSLLHSILKLPIFWAQLISAEVALFSNFALHHHWTYKAHKVEKSFYKLILQFHSVTWPAIIGSAIMVSAGEHYLHLSDLFALIISSVIALVWNFGWSKLVIWRDVSLKTVEEDITD